MLPMSHVGELVRKMAATATVAAGVWVSGCAAPVATEGDPFYTRKSAGPQAGSYSFGARPNNDPNALAAQRSGFVYGPDGRLMPSEDEDFHYGMNQMDFRRYGGHQVEPSGWKKK